MQHNQEAIFQKGQITAYPTDTSFGLGVRADDEETLEKLNNLKKRTPNKHFSLMTKDWQMLQKFAETQKNLTEKFFTEKPRTIILKPKPTLPTSKFWPKQAVAFRISTIPEVANQIKYPITATSANQTNEPPIFETKELKKIFKNKITYFPNTPPLPYSPPSEIWDYTQTPPKQIR